MDCSIYIGFDPREASAFAVARSSLRRHLTQPIPIRGLVLDDLVRAGLYTRPLEYRTSAADRPIMWDVISDAPMSTQHANARFLVPHLAGTGWALFMDGDMLVRGNLTRMFEGLDKSKAIHCVHHRHEPPPGIKMDGQEQTRYARKNWSSFVAFAVLSRPRLRGTRHDARDVPWCGPDDGEGVVLWNTLTEQYLSSIISEN
jgi:hypothetical protein